MGLDGISVNQLNFQQQNIVNNSSSQNEKTDVKPLDALSDGQKVDPDKYNKQNFNQNSDSKENQDEKIEQEPVIKYDLSDTKKYTLKLDENNNSILIMEKDTNNVVQVINVEELSKMVNFLSSPTGAIVNKKY